MPKRQGCVQAVTLLEKLEENGDLHRYLIECYPQDTTKGRSV